MFFKQLATKEASLSYFFGCAGQGKAVAGDVVAGDESVVRDCPASRPRHSASRNAGIRRWRWTRPPLSMR